MRRLAISGRLSYCRPAHFQHTPEGLPMLTDVRDANAAFPKLDDAEMEALRPHAAECEFADGEVVFKVGDPDLDLYVVESGALDILNPTNDNSLIVTHEAGEFAGDIDLLTRRPVI